MRHDRSRAVRSQYNRWLEWTTANDYRTYLCVFFIAQCVVAFNVYWASLW